MYFHILGNREKAKNRKNETKTLAGKAQTVYVRLIAR